MKRILQYKIIFVILAAVLFATSCQKKYPGNVDSPYEVVLKAIKIVNAGPSGNQVVEGVVDEVTKTVWFPRIDPATDFSAIKFEAEMSEGAQLDKESYAFEFEEGESAKSIIIKVVNQKRFREYLVTLRLLVPVFGADFDKPTLYDFSNNATKYPDFTSQLTRWTGFDGEYVLIVSRAATGPHLLKVSDLKNNVINPIPLNLTGVSGGTFAYSSGAQINGHTYICNLAGSATAQLKIYHWTDPSQPPTLIGNITPADHGVAGGRYGDNMSMDLDENGNGYMFFGDNNGGAVNPRDILRVKVTNYTTLSEPTSIPAQAGITAWMTMTKVPGTGDYIQTGYAAPIRLVNEAGVVDYALSNTAVPLNGADARVFTFNQERYLIMTGAARAASDATDFYVYDITQGSNTKEALEIFNEKASKPQLYKFSLKGASNAAPGTQSGFFITKDGSGNDEKLTLFAASTDAGFIIVEFPKKTLED